MTALVGDRRGAFGLAVLGLTVLVAVGAPHITPRVPLGTDLMAARLLGPGAVDRFGVFHLLGTDALGRDVWTRLAFGARVSVSVSGLATFLSLGVGILVGAVAGYVAGWPRAALLACTGILRLPCRGWCCSSCSPPSGSRASGS